LFYFVIFGVFTGLAWWAIERLISWFR
jgi:hypothetical protein